VIRVFLAGLARLTLAATLGLDSTAAQISHYRHLERYEGVPFGRDLILRGEERLAPILMTALATGLALVPIVLGGTRAGYEIEHPLAAVILGGASRSGAWASRQGAARGHDGGRGNHRKFGTDRQYPRR
jgi:hypothetical protein